MIKLYIAVISNIFEILNQHLVPLTEFVNKMKAINAWMHNVMKLLISDHILPYTQTQTPLTNTYSVCVLHTRM